MNLEYFIADRTAHSASSSRPNVMVRIATVSVAIGLAVMILTMAVVMAIIVISGTIKLCPILPTKIQAFEA